jgi:protein-S-isoprenylcysteine O-methyltransferase Ste14
MKKDGFWSRAFHLYYDGFRSMTLGKVLWTVILIKLFIIFVVLKLFFFPNFLKEHAEEGKESEFVANELIHRIEGLKN